MEILDFRYFEHLSQTMHFARTARALGLSASALTRRVKSMEEELGQLLLVRDHREVRLTQAGERFRTYCREQLEQWEELKNDLREGECNPTGDLRIACTVTACHTVLPEILSQFRDRYPRITLHLITQDAGRSLTQLEAGEVDLAVIPTDGEPSTTLSRVELGKTELTFIASAQFTEAQGDEPWEEVPLVAPLLGLERERLDQWRSSRKQSSRIVAEVRGNEGIIALVSLGGGIGLVPRLVLENSPLRARVEEVSSLRAPPGYAVSLCARTPSLARRAVDLFFQLAHEKR